MEVRQLRSFVAAAELGSFTRAAGLIGVTQAAISQQVAALEKELQVSLFQRQGRGVTLTERGHQLHQQAREIITLVDRALLEVGNLPRQLTGTLRIASSTVPSEWLLPELLAAFRTQWPGVHETLAVSDSQLAAAAVQSGAADVGFVGQLPSSSQLESYPVAEDELVLVVASDHPLAATGRTTLKQLSRLPLIVREPGSASRHCVEQELLLHGVAADDLVIALEANSNGAIQAAVEQGIGAAFLSAHSVRTLRGLAAIKVRGFHPRRQLYLVHTARSLQSEIVDKFVTFVTEWRSSAS